ncbi:cephalosporin hydroxylase family protein [Echinimonas agarilytica]|uniref:Cephalosporin hydroxylase family protein n=1 Tax=Echinimonas agarilytica TaxID=1215918 RepID=A0AA42B784_9GAMM|nr:CmcI family methyltransferase [Echinimonas agarilytica]MCM2678953.1 cephalosporin hydroxylase family protein [Echinimonas agarilytica]
MSYEKSPAVIQFHEEKKQRIAGYRKDAEWQELNKKWVKKAFDHQYMYNFSWMGRPVIQMPADFWAMHELIWEIKPSVIIECGIAHGGALIFYASQLEMLGKGKAIGVDIEIRPHNREAIESHEMFKRIDLVEGSSVADSTVAQVKQLMANETGPVMVCLDSMHTEEHVIAELNAYAELVTSGSYLVVFDTVVEELPKGYFDNRPWDVGNSPMTAVNKWLTTRTDFVRSDYDDKLVATACNGGFLKKI